MRGAVPKVRSYVVAAQSTTGGIKIPQISNMAWSAVLAAVRRGLFNSRGVPSSVPARMKSSFPLLSIYGTSPVPKAGSRNHGILRNLALHPTLAMGTTVLLTQLAR